MINNYLSRFLNITKKFFLKCLEIVKVQLKKIYLNKKHLIWKFFIFFLIALIICLSSFLIRNTILKATTTQWDLIPGFLRIRITENTGISFGNLSNSNPSLVYFIQSVPIILGVFVFLFSYSYFLDVGISIFFFGGLCNLIDRAIYDSYTNSSLSYLNASDAVVDYLQFSFINNSAIFNLPDVYIISGVVLIALQIIISWIKEYRQEAKSKNKDEPIKDTVLDEEKNRKKNKITYKTIDPKKIKK